MNRNEIIAHIIKSVKEETKALDEFGLRAQPQINPKAVADILKIEKYDVDAAVEEMRNNGLVHDVAIDVVLFKDAILER